MHTLPRHRRVIDDAGNTVEMLGVTSRDRERVASPIARFTLVASIVLLLTSALWMHWAAFGIAFALNALGVKANHELYRILVFTLLTMIICSGWSFASQSRPARANRVIAARRVASGLCGACECPLEALNESHETLVVCPECGAAWRPPASSDRNEPRP